MKRAWVWAVVSFLVALLCTGEARSQPAGATGKDTRSKKIFSKQMLPGLPPATGHVELEYLLGEGTATCDREATWRGWLRSDFRVDPFVVQGAVEHKALVVMAQRGPAFAGMLEVTDSTGTVIFRQKILERTCARLADTLLLLAEALFLEPVQEECENACTQKLERRIEQLEDENAKLKDDGRRERDDRRRDTGELWLRLEALQKKVERVRVQAMQLTYALSTGLILTFNLTPNVGPALYLGGELRSGPLSLGMEVRSVLPSRVQVGPYAPDLSQYVALLVPCGRYLYFFGCAIAGGGTQLIYDSSGSVRTGGTYPLLQLGGRLGIEFPFAENRLAVRAWGEVLYSTPSTRFNEKVDGVTKYTWDRPDVSGFFGLGFVVKFGDNEAR